MSEKNFVSYGDAETIMTELSNKIKQQNTQYVRANGAVVTKYKRLHMVENPESEISYTPDNYSTSIVNVHTHHSGTENGIKDIRSGSIVVGQFDNDNNTSKIYGGSGSNFIFGKAEWGYSLGYQNGSGTTFVFGRSELGDHYSKSSGAAVFGNSNSTDSYDSFIEGRQNNIAGSASGAHAEGGENSINAKFSHIEGYNNKIVANSNVNYGLHVEGHKTSYLADGSNLNSIEGSGAHIEGQKSYAVFNNRPTNGYGYLLPNAYWKNEAVDAVSPHVEGYSCKIKNVPYSHAEGFRTGIEFTGDRFGANHAEGFYSKVFGSGASHAEGYSTRIGSNSGYGNHAEGYNTFLSGGDGVHVEGYNTHANRNGAHAEGLETTALVMAAHTEGMYTHAYYGEAAHAEGKYTLAQGGRSHSEGCFTAAIGADGSHAGGHGIAYYDFSHLNSFVSAIGYASFAHGYMHSDMSSGITNVDSVFKATGEGSMAFGISEANASEDQDMNTLSAEGSGSVAMGINVRARARAQFAVGRYNSYTTNTGDIFFVGKGTSGNRANAFRVSDLGVYADGPYNSSGADYAEMFEWIDGNFDNEDRRGLFVVLAADRIRTANEDDDIDDILGIVSADPSVCGDVHDDQWKGMYLRDIFGAPIMEEYEETVWTGEYDEEGDKIMETRTQKRQKLNPEYDPKITYIPRSERKEWSAVGMLGKLVMVSDGSIKAGDFIKSGANGKATKSDNRTRFYCMERLDDTHIRVLIK